MHTLLPFDVPVHHDPRAAVALVPLGHEVRRPRPELAGVRHIRRPAVGRVVLETSILRWIVRRGDNNAIAQVFLATSVVNQNGMRNGGRRSNTVVALDYCFDIVGGQNFKRGALRWRRQRMCVLAHIERTIDSLAAAIVANGLSDCQDESLGEGPCQR